MSRIGNKIITIPAGVSVTVNGHDVTVKGPKEADIIKLAYNILKEVKPTKDLSQITLEMLAALNTLSKKKDRLIEMTVDGEISPDEVPDFLSLKDELEKMAIVIDSLNLWIDNSIASGKMDKNLMSK